MIGRGSPSVLDIFCQEWPQPDWLLLTECVAGGSISADARCESRKAWDHTVDILCDIVSRPPIILGGKERTERKLRADEVDNAEAVVDVQSAEIVL